MVDPLRARVVPKPDAVQEVARERAPEALGDGGFAQILLLQIPGVTHRRVAIADVQLPRCGENTLGHGVRIADDQIILREVQLLDGERHDRQQALVDMFDEGNFLQDGGLDRLALQAGAVALRHAVDQAEDIGFGKHRQHDFEDFLGAGIGVQPLMDQSDSRRDSLRTRRTQDVIGGGRVAEQSDLQRIDQFVLKGHRASRLTTSPLDVTFCNLFSLIRKRTGPRTKENRPGA